MDSLIVEYKGTGGMYIVRITEGKYYYGNGADINGVGISPAQFLRFNPYLEYVGEEKLPVPASIRAWIEGNMPSGQGIRMDKGEW